MTFTQKTQIHIVLGKVLSNIPLYSGDLLKRVNLHFDEENQFNPSTLREAINYVRSKGLLPVISTSKGYWISYDKREIFKTILSLRSRAKSINAAADGLLTHIKD